MDKVRKPRRRGATRVSAKNQVTIPVDALRQAALKPGDELRVEAAGAGRIVLTREEDPISRYAGSLPEAYGPGYLDELRKEWV